jgi:O-acetyl-ADP-ribose deacetylase (regulator of RNase III)
MPIEIIRDDITKVHADAIVNAANSSLLVGRGVDGSIHSASGPKLLSECRRLGGCKVGQAKITKGYNLPAKYVIHTVGPIWNGGNNNEEELLSNAYRNSLLLAKEYKLESIAFPLISTGAFRFPKQQALKIAISVIQEFLLHNEMTIFLVIYDKGSFMLSKNMFKSIKEYIDDNYIKEINSYEMSSLDGRELPHMDYAEIEVNYSSFPKVSRKKRSLHDLVKQMDETFSQRLLRLIDQKGMTDVETYRKANIDRKLFSKIRNDINYKPSKPTAIAFAIALQLNLNETKDLLMKAGFALSNSSKFDIIIQYFIENENYNIMEVNMALYEFDENTLKC